MSQPTVHTHVTDMLNSELLRESAEWKKAHPLENFYEPNFPVVRAADRAAFEQICQEMAEELANLFQARQSDLQGAVETTSLAQQGWSFAELAQYCYASVQRGARKTLEDRGVLLPRQGHRNGAEWLFWAEEANARRPGWDQPLRNSGATPGRKPVRSRRS